MIIDDMRLVFVASPWSGGPRSYREYLRKAVHDCFSRFEAPIAAHGFYPRYLDDKDPHDRQLGLECGAMLLLRCDLLAIYADHGITSGMQGEINAATAQRLPIEWRYILARKPKGEANGSNNRHGDDNEGDDSEAAS